MTLGDFPVVLLSAHHYTGHGVESHLERLFRISNMHTNNINMLNIRESHLILFHIHIPCGDEREEPLKRSAWHPSWICPILQTTFR